MKIAILWPNWIGDAVMATPAVRAIRTHFPDADWINILKPYIAGVLEGAPWEQRQVFLDSRGPWPYRWPAVARRLHRENADVAVVFPNSFRSALVAWLGRCRRRIGYSRYGRTPFLTEPVNPVRGSNGELLPSPVLLAYNRLAEELGCKVDSLRMHLFTTRQDEAAADSVWHKFNRGQEIICLNPGAAFGSAKFWPVERFVSLARDLIDRRGSGIVVLCGPAERILAAEIVKRTDRRAIQSLADHRLSLGLTKACVRRADLLITTDSGPRHFAAAFDRPVISLFGPTHIAWTETYHAKAIHLQKQVPCGPCQLRVCPLDHRCMKLLTPGEVFESAQSILDGQERSPSRWGLQPTG